MKTGQVVLALFLGLMLVAPAGHRALAAPGQAASIAPKMGQESQAQAIAHDGSASTNGIRPFTLDVVVTGKSGEPVSGLQPGDFKLLDNKQPQELVSVVAAGGLNAKADPPVEVILAIDAVNMGYVGLTDEIQWLHKYLDRSGGQLALPTSFAILADRQVTLQNHPTRDAKALGDYIDRNRAGFRALQSSSGLWGAQERQQISLRALRDLAAAAAKRPGRKLLIWISPGWFGVSDAAWTATKKDQEQLFGSIVDTSTSLRQARVTLDSIDPTITGGRIFNVYWEGYLKGVTEPKKADTAHLLLPVLATQSGGQVQFGSTDLPDLIDRCIADASAYYVVTFNPPPAAHPGEYHELSVEVAKPGLKARTRMGYYAQPAGGVALSGEGEQVSR